MILRKRLLTRGMAMTVGVCFLLSTGGALAGDKPMSEDKPTAAANAPATGPTADTSKKTATPSQDALNTTAKELYEQANAARAAGDWQGCYAKARAAWAAQEHRRVAAVLGECALMTQRPVEAATFLDYYLARLESADSTAIRSYMSGKFAEAQTQVATVVIQVDPVDARLLIDGKSAEGDSDKRVFLSEGEHVIEGHHAERESAKKVLTAVVGTSTTIRLVLPPKTKGEGTPVLLYTGIGVAALGVIGLGVGVGMTVVADGAASEAFELSQGLTPRACTAPIDADLNSTCIQIAEKRNEHDSASNAATGSFIIGGTLIGAGAGMVIYHFVSNSGEDEQQAKWLVTPTVGPHSRGLNFQMVW